MENITYYNDKQFFITKKYVYTRYLIAFNLLSKQSNLVHSCAQILAKGLTLLHPFSEYSRSLAQEPCV